MRGAGGDLEGCCRSGRVHVHKGSPSAHHHQPERGLEGTAAGSGNGGGVSEHAESGRVAGGQERGSQTDQETLHHSQTRSEEIGMHS